MKKTLFIKMIISLAILSLFVSCEDLFTMSLASYLQRDYSSLPVSAQIERAEQALYSDDPGEADEAFNAIQKILGDKSPSDSDYEDIVGLSVDLAVKASGVEDAITSLADTTSDGGDIGSALNDILTSSSLDLDYFDTAYSNVSNIDSSKLDDDQLLFLAAGLALKQAKETGTNDLDSLTSGTPRTDAALALVGQINAEEGTDLANLVDQLNTMIS
ncbi:hypothetical protein [Spirochaeta cellobiosiphila]|uniref:hypothetical protein n=1 Tax=Spirochaeta cellobiosiphila TaxID=504483 RepID=UPI00040767AC|nr:hypothetical protein [Spirochaeta cellobiosiphila]